MSVPVLSLAAIRQPAFLYDAAARIVEANDLADALARRSLAGCTLAAVGGIFHVRSPDGTPLSAAGLPASRALRGEEAVDVPLVVTAADGRILHILATASPIRDGDAVTGALVVWQNVTDLVAAKDALRESEARFRSVLESSRDVVYRMNLQTGRYEYFSPSVESVLGYTPGELMAQDPETLLLSMIHPDDIPALRALLDRLEETGKVDAEYRERTKDGEYHWISNRISLIRDDAGRPLYRAGIMRDISSRKRAEEALRESEAKYRRFVDDDITGLFISLPDGRLLDCNPAFARMFGFASVEEARSSSVIETYVVPGERDALLARLRRERRLENEERFRRRHDGTTIHVVENLVGDFDPAGELVQIRGYIRDDTQRYLAENALRERERMLQGIFRAAPVGIGMVSHRIIVEANDQLCRMTGYSRDELIGRDARMLYPSEEAYEYVGREKYAQILADGVGAIETQWRRKDGVVRDVLVSSSPMDLARPYEDVVFNALDITRLRESERALERYMDELRVSNEELQRFAYVASHDLQEPLRSIISFSQLLERRYKGRLDSDADEYIGFITDGGMRMQRLIEDLLLLSRVETKAAPPAPTESEAVVYDVLRLMEAAIADAGATVTVGPMPRVMADEAQLAQVFQNLVSNALKYRREGVPPEVRISAERDGQFWQFAVADNGIGIEEEYYDRIFVIFQRLHTRDEYAGTGIGLAVVKRIVERHGGRIRVESTPGEGSTFFFTLPAA